MYANVDIILRSNGTAYKNIMTLGPSLAAVKSIHR